MRLSHVPLTAAAGATAAVLAAAPAVHAADAVYGGTTAGGDPIVVKADPVTATLRSIVISWRATCADGDWVPGGGTLTATEPVPGFVANPADLLMSKNAKGAFAGTQLSATGSGTLNLEIKGKLKPAKASGTLSATVKMIDPATGNAAGSCQTTQKWTATRDPGIIYGGASSQGLPFVVRLDKQRKRVNDVITTWLAPCTPEGLYRLADHFINFPVKRTGGFGNPFAFDVDLEAGGKRHIAYTFSGRITSKAANGRLQVKLADTDAAGAPGPTCDTGGMTWKAATG